MKKILLGTLMSLSLGAAAAPILNLFELGIQPGQSAAYDEVGQKNISASVGGEAGTLAMYSVKQQDQPQLAYMVEIYADEAAYQTHIKSPQYKHFLERSPAILTDHKRKINLVPQYLADKKVEQTAATVSNLAIVEVKGEQDSAFRAVVLAEMAQAMKVEAGVLAIYAATEKENPHRWYFFEIYADEAAYQSQRATAHFKDYLAKTAALIDHKRAVAIVPTLLQNKGGLNYSVE